MATTEAELTTLIDKIDTELDSLLTGDGSGTLNYKKEGLTYDKTSRIRELRAWRKDLVDERARLPVEETTVFDDPAL